MGSRKKRLAAARARFQPEIVDYRNLEAAALGRCIKQRREYLKLTQKALAALADLTPAAMCRIEKGQALPKAGTLTRLCSALQCSLTQLIYPVSAQQRDNSLASASKARKASA